MTDTRAPRTVVIFLIVLTIIVFLPVTSAAHGSTLSGWPAGRPPPGSRFETGAAAGRPPAAGAPIAMQIEETGDLLVSGSTAHRTLVLRGLRPRSGEVDLDWDARVSGGLAASGRGSISSRSGGSSRIVLSIPLPSVDRPAGLELRVRATDAGQIAGEATFPFTLYPAEAGRRLAELLALARVGLYDPEGKATRVLRSLGLAADEVGSSEDLALYRGDLIVVGPGGFARGREGLGPVLAARARSGTPVLILDQPSLPGTLSEDLRLWPSFIRAPDSAILFAAGHPVLQGLPLESGAAYFAAAEGRVRPLLPPTRGNFRVLAEVRSRGASSEEGVALLEFPIGDGTVLAAQASLCTDYPSDARARILLANALAYLIGGRHPLKRTFLYGTSSGDLPACLAHLAPRAQAAPPDLQGTEVLLVPADWRAPRLKGSRSLPPLARVARFLREGGTVVLLNPQTLVPDYLRGVSGSAVYFDDASSTEPDRAASPAAMDLLQGIAADDLALLERPGRAEFRLRPAPGPGGVEAILVRPGLAFYRVGAGTLVALTLPEASDCSLPRTSSLLARLLTNLGVPLDPGPGIDPEAITLLNQ